MSKIGWFDAQPRDRLVGGEAAAAAPGVPVVRKFPFAYNTPGLATGAPIYTPTVGDVLLTAWFQLVTPFDGVYPHADVGAFNGITTGWIGSDNLPFRLDGFHGTSFPAPSQLGLFPIDGPTQGGFMPVDFTRAVFTVAQPLKLVVSQDARIASPAAATCLADSPPALPLTVVTGTNDEFIFAGATNANGGGAAAPETFTIAAGTYTTMADLVGAVGAALGASAEAFSTKVTPSDSAGTLLLTMVTPGAAQNHNAITPGGNDISAGIGFSSQGSFLNGQGGASGSTVGAANLYLVTATPA